MANYFLYSISIISFSFLMSCADHQIKPVNLDTSKTSAGSVKISHHADRLLIEASYTQISGEDSLNLTAGNTNGNGLERLTNGKSEMLGPDTVKVNMDFSEVGGSVRYAMINKDLIKYRLGASANYQKIDDEFIGKSSRFSTSFDDINLWLDNELVVSLNEKLSLNIMISMPVSQQYFIDNSRVKFGAKYQFSKNISLELVRYNYSVTAANDPNISYEKIYCPNSTLTAKQCASGFSGERSDVSQIFSGFGLELGFNF